MTVELLKEMKHIKKGGHCINEELSSVVGGAEGSQAIAEMFRDSYSNLFNSAPSHHELTDLLAKLNLSINDDSYQDVEKVTGIIVKEAVMKLKAGKSDVSNSFVSDALRNSPDNLFALLAQIFKSWLIHGTITSSLLACSFMPLLKM